MKAVASQSWSTLSVGSGGTRIRYFLCGAPALTRTAWTRKNFGRRYCKCASNEGYKFWDWVDTPIDSQTEQNAFAPNDGSCSIRTMPCLKDKEWQLQKNEKIELEDNSKLKMTNMESLLKELHEREEKYFKLLVGTWVVVGCFLIMLFTKMA